MTVEVGKGERKRLRGFPIEPVETADLRGQVNLLLKRETETDNESVEHS
jgi:hypothetical protein